MDLSDPKTWTDGAKIVLEAPQIVAPLLGGVIFGTWWLTSRIDHGTKEKLREQIKVHEAHRKFAEDRASDFDRKLGAVTAQLTTLEGQIRRGDPQQGLLVTANSTATAIGELRRANTEILRALGTTAGAPKLAAPQLTPHISSIDKST
jgi:hypothetical protein